MFFPSFQNTLKQLFNKNINTTYQRSAMYSMLSRAPPSVKARQLSASEATTQISLHFTNNTVNGHKHPLNSRASQNREKTTVLSHKADALKLKKQRQVSVRKKRDIEKAQDKTISSLAQKMLRMFEKERDTKRAIIRQTSAGSANTISNSSLQDMDEIDFSSSDLVKYMEEINGDLT